MSSSDQPASDPGNISAFNFDGSWPEFAKIALPNVLLSIVTLGIYRFWATTRERQYLWSHTRFIDEPLEWTGRGMELFIGFILVFFLIGLPFLILNLVLNGLIFRGQPVIAGILILVISMLVFYLTGLAYFRALRYRLSRTYWRGIRGGSDNPGFQYGLSYISKNIAGAIPIFLLYPWATMSLWNERWGHMSFGPYQFESNADWKQMMKRYLLFYLLPFLLLVGIFAAGVGISPSGSAGPPFQSAGGIVGVVLIMVAVLGMYILLPIAALMYFSKFFRVAVGGLRLGDLQFEFKARSPDWILYWLGNIAFMAVAYGLAAIPFSLSVPAKLADIDIGLQSGNVMFAAGFVVSVLLALVPVLFASAIVRYRRWRFGVFHMEAYGEVNLDRLTQSETKISEHGEGLLDALDVGAI